MSEIPDNQRIEPRSRSIVKALSWRVIATAITVCTAFYLTGKAEIAITIGMIDTVIKLVSYYGHERAWAYIWNY